MADILNPFSGETNPYDESSVMTRGARSLANAMQAQDERDPVADQMAALNHRKTQLSYAKQGTEILRDKFLAGEGAGLFATDPTTGKTMQLPDKSGYVPQMGTDLDSLRARTGGKVGTLQGIFSSANAGDPTDDAKAAAAELAAKEPIYKAKMDKFQRIQDQLSRITQAHTDAEFQLGSLAASRLQASGVLPDDQTAPSQPSPATSPYQRQTSGGTMTRNGVTTVVPGQGQPPANPFSDMNGDGVRAPGQQLLQNSSVVEQNFHKVQADGSIPSSASNYDAPAPDAQPPAPVGATPLQLVQLQKRMKDNETVMGMDTTNDNLREALRQKNDRQMDAFSKGMALLPADQRQRVIDMTRDPTLLEKSEQAIASLGTGLGKTLVDIPEFVGRQVLRTTNALGATNTNLDHNGYQDFLSAMKQTADEWGPNVPPEVREKLKDNLVSKVSEGLGATAGFLIPGAAVGRLAKIAGLSQKVIGALNIAAPAIQGAMSNANALRSDVTSANDQLDAQFQQDVKAGRMTPDAYKAAQSQMNKQAAQAEALGTVIGGGMMAVGPMSTFLGRIAGSPEGASFARTFMQKLVKLGPDSAQEFAEGAGKNILSKIVSGADEGAKMSMIMAGQRMLNTATLKSTGNAAFQDRKIFDPNASGEDAANFLTGALVSAITHHAAPEPGAAPDAGQKPGESVPPPAPETPAAQATPAAPESAPSDNAAPPVDADLKAELDAQAKTTPPANEAPLQGSESGAGSAPNPRSGDETNSAPALPVASTDGKTVQQWTFKDADGKQKSVTATGLEDATSKLPEGFKPDSKELPTHEVIAAPVDHATPQDLKGDQIDKEWTKFSPESQSLGIPREEMPQIKSEARGALTQFLKARGVEHTQEEVLPGTLKPTQEEYSQGKVDDSREKSAELGGNDRSILVSSDNHIVDGHHQWLAKLHDEPNKPIRVIRLDAPIKDVLANVKEFPSVKQAGGAAEVKPISQPAEQKPGHESAGAETKSKAEVEPAGKPPIEKGVHSAAEKETPPDRQPQSNALTELAPNKSGQGSREEQTAKTEKKGKRIGVGLPVSGEGDILNAIEDHGGVRSRESVKKPGGEYDDFNSSFKGASRLLIRRDGAEPVDQLAKTLHDDGHLPDSSTSTLYDAVQKAVRAREVSRKQAGKEGYQNRFERAFLGNEHPREYLRSGKAITVDDLNAGDSFTVDGEKFEVKSVDEHGNVTIKDGITREVPAGTPVYPDRGKVKKAKVEKDFLSSKSAPPGELFGADETPFNLAGAEQADGERLLNERIDREQAKRDQDKAQTRIPGTEDESQGKGLDINASTPGNDSAVDPTSPKAFTFRNLAPHEINENRAKVVQEFEDKANSERRKRGAPVTKYTSVQLSPDERGLRDTSSTELHDGSLQGGGAPTAKVAQAQAARFVRSIEEALGKRIIFVRSSQPEAWSAATAKERANTIIVNADGNAPIHALIGHEIGHNIEGQNPDLFRRLESVVRELAGDPTDRYTARKLAEGYQAERVKYEWISDVFGQRFDEPEFWKEASKIADKQGKSQSFRELAQSTLDWVSKFWKRLLVLNKDVDSPALKNIDKLRKSLAGILNDYVTQKPDGGYPEDPTLKPATDDELSRQASTSAESKEDQERSSQSPRTERKGGNAVDDITYNARPRETFEGEAKSYTETHGETKAVADAIDPANRSIPEDTKQAIIFHAFDRMKSRMLNPETSPGEQESLVRQMNSLSAAANPETRNLARGLSARGQLYGGNSVGAMDQLIRQKSDEQTDRLGKSGVKAVEDATKVLNDASDKAAAGAVKKISRSAKDIPLNRTLWQRYRDDTANRLVSLVDSAGKVPEDKAPLQDFTQRIVDEMKARIKAFLPESPESERPKPSTTDILREMIDNKDKYADILTSTRNAFAEKYGEGSAPLNLIDTELANMGLKPYSQKLIDLAVKDAHTAMQTKISDIAKQHFTKTDAQAGNLADALVQQAGIKGADATQLAADISEHAKGLYADAREKAIADLQKRFTATPQAKAVFNAVDRAKELNNIGALTHADVQGAVAKALKLPEAKPEQLKKLASLADKVETAENPAAKARATLDLANEMRLARSPSKWSRALDTGTSVWYANLLMGSALGVKTVGDTLNSVSQMGTALIANPRNAGDLVGGWLSGLGAGFDRAKATFTEGKGGLGYDPLTSGYGKDGEAPRPLSALEDSKNIYTGTLKYVPRAFKAIEAFFYQPAREAYARLAATKLLQGEYKGKELMQKVRETLGVAPDQFVRFQKQAEKEGFKGADLGLRVGQLVEQHRQSSDVGAEAQKTAERFAGETVYKQKPTGIAGVIYRVLDDAVNDKVKIAGVPVLKAFMPFLKIPTNLMNESLNYTPIGIKRAAFSTLDSTGKAKVEMTSDERTRMAIQGIGGTLLMGALVALATNRDKNGDHDFDISGAGPTDYNKRIQLQQSGWIQHGVKIGGVWYNYIHSPLMVPLSVVGNVADSVKYQKQKDEMFLASRVADAVAGGARSIFDASMLQGVSNLMDFVKGNTSQSRITKFLASTATSMVIPTAVRQIDSILSPVQRNGDGPLGVVGSSIPFLRREGSPRTDTLGQPQTYSPTQRFASPEKPDPLRDTLREKNVFISAPSRDTKIGAKPMDPETYNNFVRISGERIRQRLEPMAATLARLSPEQVEKIVTSVTEQERHVAKGMVRSQPAPVAGIYNPFK